MHEGIIIIHWLDIDKKTTCFRETSTTSVVEISPTWRKRDERFGKQNKQETEPKIMLVYNLQIYKKSKSSTQTKSKRFDCNYSYHQ